MTTSLAGAAVFAASFAALYAAHHVGDYWIQTDHQAAHKGDPKREGKGRGACAGHVLTYVLTQNVFLILTYAATGLRPDRWALLAALVVSGATHYWADRRWTLEAFARMIPGKINFYHLGMPRKPSVVSRHPEVGLETVCTDNPCLGTGAWALDQSFHLTFSVFVPALMLAVAA